MNSLFKRQILLVLLISRTAWCTASTPERAAPLSTFTRLPIKEVTVFKDGHAFVAHEGSMNTDEAGNVVMDYLPTPVIGTFWPYSAESKAKLTGVVAGHKRVLVERTALSLYELLKANVGADAIIQEAGTNRYEATILGLPARSAEEWESTSPPNTPERLPEQGNIVLLKTSEGTKAVSLDNIKDVTFKSTPHVACGNEEFRNLMTLKLDWAGAKPAKSAKVGLFYLQKGMRWIPSYKLEIDGKGTAAVKLQATLLNELADLNDVSVNLVIGVPSFAFKDTVDPIALQQNLAQLSQYFQAGGAGQGSQLAYNFGNAIMSQQSVRASDFQGASQPGEAASLGPEIGEGGKTEDLFVFNLPHVSMKKGDRVVLTIAEFNLPYRDVFSLELPFSPPPEVRGNFSNQQQRELARLFNSPKVMHKIRLTNKSKYPLTTAPALVLSGGRALAQGLMTYTSTGVDVDLSVTTAIDFQVNKTEEEVKRTPNALQHNGSSFSRIDLTGRVGLTNHRAEATEVEVTRYVLGTLDSSQPEAKLQKLNMFEDSGDGSGNYPYWWNSYGWPYWWHHLNGIGQVTWKIKLEPNKPLELKYAWHYFWQ